MATSADVEKQQSDTNKDDRFKPVDLKRDGQSRTAENAEELTKLMFDGWQPPTKK